MTTNQSASAWTDASHIASSVCARSQYLSIINSFNQVCFWGVFPVANSYGLGRQRQNHRPRRHGCRLLLPLAGQGARWSTPRAARRRSADKGDRGNENQTRPEIGDSLFRWPVSFPAATPLTVKNVPNSGQARGCGCVSAVPDSKRSSRGFFKRRFRMPK